VRAAIAAIAGLFAVTAFATDLPDPAKEQQAMEAGAQAVIYGLPLVLMDITMRKTTNVSAERRMATAHGCLPQCIPFRSRVP